MAGANEQNSVEQMKKEPVFTKAQIVKSRKYATRQDALNAILKEDEKYTLEQVDQLLEKFYKGGNK